MIQVSKIDKIDILNVKGCARFTAEGLAPRGVIVLAGKNGAGKSSVVEFLESLFPGGSVPPLRNGAENGKGTVTFDDGTVVTRTIPGEIELTLPGGGYAKRPKDHLAAMLGRLGGAALNPGRIMAMQPRDRRALLQRLTNFDAAPFDEKISEATERQRALDADLKALQNRNAGLSPISGVPNEEMDVAALSAALQQDLDHNAKWQRVQDQKDAFERERTQLTTEIKRLQTRLAEVENEIDAADANLEVGAFVDTSALRQQIADAEETNRKVRHNAQIAAARKEWNDKEPERAKLAAEVKTAKDSKVKALAEAPFPVSGMGLEDSDISYNGIPWEDLSAGEQRRLAAAIALSETPAEARFRFLDGNDLDKDARAALYEQVKASGEQMIIELSDEDAQEGDLVIRIKDGVSQ